MSNDFLDDDEYGVKGGLASQALSGALTTTVVTGFYSFLQLVVLVVLARLIDPAEFGLVTAATVVLGFCSLFVSVGIGPALVQRQKLEQKHLDAALTLSTLFGLVACGAVMAAAPLVADGFHMERLTNVVRVLSLGFLLVGPGIVAQSILSRRLRFRAVSLISLLGYAFGYVVVGVPLAALQKGVWALVAAALSNMAFITIVSLVVERTGARYSLRLDGARDLLSYGAGFTLGGIAHYFAENADNMVVGRVLGAQALGYYGRAYQFLLTPAQWLGIVPEQVLFPVLARIQVDRERLRTAYERCMSILTLGAIPLTVMLVILAPEIVQVLMGDKWLEVTLPFQILAVAVLPRVTSKLAKSVAKATGAVFASAWRQIVHAVLVALGAWLGSYRGVAGVAVGVLAAAVLGYGLMVQLTVKLTGISWVSFLRAHWRGTAVAAVWLAIGWPCAHALRLTQIPDVAVLIIVIVGLLLVLAGLWLVFPQVFLGADGRWIAQSLRAKLHLKGQRG